MLLTFFLSLEIIFWIFCILMDHAHETMLLISDNGIGCTTGYRTVFHLGNRIVSAMENTIDNAY